MIWEPNLRGEEGGSEFRRGWRSDMHFGGAARLGRAKVGLWKRPWRKEDPGSTGDHGQRETASPYQGPP